MKRAHLAFTLCGMAVLVLLGEGSPLQAQFPSKSKPPSTPSKKIQPEIQEQLRRAEDLFEFGKFDEALAVCDKILRQAPQAVGAHRLYVRIRLAQTSNPFVVADEYRAKMAAEPKNPVYPLVLALEPYLTFATQDGEELYIKTAELTPLDWAWGQYALGWLKKQQGDHEAALAAFRKAAELEPENASLVQYLARFLVQRKQFDEAMAVCQKLIRANPHRYSAYLDLWKAQLAQTGTNPETVRQVEKELEALNARPERSPRLLQCLAEAYGTILNQPDKAETVTAELRKTYPDWGKFSGTDYLWIQNQTGLVRRYFFFGPRKFSYNRLKEALELPDRNARITALETLTKEPLDDQFRGLLFDHLLQQYDANDLAKMETLAAQTVQLDPENVGVYYLVGTQMANRQDMLKPALGYAEKLVAATKTMTPAKRPDNFDERAWKADFGEAKQQANQQIQQAKAFSLLGRVLFEMGDYAQAEAALRKANPMYDPTWGGTAYHLGLTLDKLGKPLEAAEKLAQVVAEYGSESSGHSAVTQTGARIDYGARAAQALRNLEKRYPTIKTRTVVTTTHSEVTEGLRGYVAKNFIREEPRDFELTSLTGRRIRLSELRGKVVLMNFWASWCGPCVAEFPHLKALFHKYRKEDVEFLSMNTDQNREAARAFLDQERPVFPVFFGQGVQALYRVKGIPHTVFFGRDGKVRYRSVGFSPDQTEAEFQIVLEELLHEP
ncbi:MAG: tetratricopeptide repeat protein [Blastocatellia bacterium]|nr:tetratricopeptide repeat protein [Blastocatellia bacterium]